MTQAHGALRLLFREMHSCKHASIPAHAGYCMNELILVLEISLQITTNESILYQGDIPLIHF